MFIIFNFISFFLSYTRLFFLPFITLRTRHVICKECQTIDRMQHTMRAPIVGEVVAALEEVVNVFGGGGDHKVVVVDEGDGVDEGGEKRDNGVFIGKTQRELELGANLYESDRNS